MTQNDSALGNWWETGRVHGLGGGRGRLDWKRATAESVPEQVTPNRRPVTMRPAMEDLRLSERSVSLAG